MKSVFFSLMVFFFSYEAFSKEKVFVSFYPLEYATKFLVGDSIEVWNPVKTDPAEWKPTKALISEIQKSRLIIINGAGFEKWIKLVSLPKSKLVVTSSSFKKDWVKYKSGGKAHSHGGKVHVHRGFDGHTWMSPRKFLKQIDAIYTALLGAKLVEPTTLKNRYNDLKAQLVALDSKWIEVGKKIAQQGTILANHPAYNYLAKDYQFKVKNFDFSPDEPLSTKDKKSLQEFVKKNSAKYLWWESEPLKENKTFVEGVLGLKSITISPSEVAGQKKFLEVMNQNISNI